MTDAPSRGFKSQHHDLIDLTETHLSSRGLGITESPLELVELQVQNGPGA